MPGTARERESQTLKQLQGVSYGDGPRISQKRMEGDRIRFTGGLGVLAFVLVLVMVDATWRRLLRYRLDIGPGLPVVDTTLLSAMSALLALGIVVGILRLEGVSLGVLGLRPALIGPAVLAVGAFYAAANLIAAGIAIGTGNLETIGYQWTVSPIGAVWVFLVMLVVAGVVEEVIFRGYVQTKLIALLPRTRWMRIGLGILLGAVLFAAWHVPRVLTDGPPGGMTSQYYLLTLTINGIAFGLMYELTHNLSIPILIHAAGNMPGTAGILFFTTAGWPALAVLVFTIAQLLIAIGVVLAYRRWAFETGYMPVWTEREVNRETGMIANRPSIVG